jgi:hypothetical protein
MNTTNTVSGSNVIESESESVPPARAVANVTVEGQVVKQAAPGDEQLGDLYFYSIPSNLEVQHDDLKALADQVGLPKAWLPRVTRGENAFQRATKVLEHMVNKEHGKLRMQRQGAAEVASVSWVSLRPAPRQPCFRNVVKETRIGTARPVYETLGQVWFNPQGASVDGATQLPEGPDKDAFGVMVERVRRFYKHYCTHYIDVDIRNLLLRAKWDLATILFRKSGGIYFVPVSKRPLLRTLKEFLQGLGCEIMVIPLSEQVTDPKYIGQKLVGAVDAEAELVLREMEKYMQKPSLSPERFAGLCNAASRVRALHEEYEGLLNTDLGAAVLKLEAMGARLRELGGRVSA